MLTTLPHSCVEHGSIKLLETSGLVQACNGIALRFTAATQVYVRDRLQCQDGTAQRDVRTVLANGYSSYCGLARWPNF